MEKKTNVIVSCVYRASGAKSAICKDSMEEMFSKTNQKVLFICGDFNIYLLNPNKHNMTERFIDAMNSTSLYPKITRARRRTSQCATLIVHIFTNVLEEKTSGLLINDISDHLPVFVVYDCIHKKDTNANNFKDKRV